METTIVPRLAARRFFTRNSVPTPGGIYRTAGNRTAQAPLAYTVNMPKIRSTWVIL